MRTYERKMTRHEVRKALYKFYGSGENLRMAYETVDWCIANKADIHNVCPNNDGGMFSFTWVKGKDFICKSDFPELIYNI